MNTENNPFASTVSEYPDEKLIHTIKNPKSFSPKLVFGCELEAKSRGLDLNGDNRDLNPFSATVATYDDQKLQDVISNPHRYAANLVSASKAQAKKRGLTTDYSSPTTSTAAGDADFVRMIHDKIQSGQSTHNILATLTNQGIPEERALALLEKAIRSAPNRQARRNTNQDSDGVSGWTIFWIILVVIKMLLLFSR